MAPAFVRPSVRALSGYVPGEQPPIGQRVVKLNTNENPFPPSPKVMEAIRQVEPELLRRYPNPMADSFRAAAARVLGIPAEMILCGNGSDDLLTIATRTFVAPGGTLAAPEPTYSLYPVLAALEEARFVPVPWTRDYDLPINGLLAARAEAIFIVNPNAPTGTFVSPARIAELAEQFRGLILVDEAYVDFADENCALLVNAFENLVVTRSLSKSYSLAGLRFGYAIAQPHVIAEMAKVKDSYNCDAISTLAATAAIEDQEYARRTWEHVKSERLRVSEELAAMGWGVIPSRANFILASVPGGRARDAWLRLKEQGILVRYFDQPGLRDKLRITIGTIQENNALLGAVKSLQLVERAA
ncbi:MAG: histidinol-phosphate transaminase [Phycisphaerae bacterium]|nr:histidinol-phosphate transaminase [Phycisphaerae bacterium]MDW8261146.1 histidinol-phosphate transaminase [Phycisphaerales bacterium]